MQALLEKQRSEQAELFDSVKGTEPGTAGRQCGGMSTRLHTLVTDQTSVAALSSDGQA